MGLKPRPFTKRRKVEAAVPAQCLHTVPCSRWRCTREPGHTGPHASTAQAAATFDYEAVRRCTTIFPSGNRCMRDAGHLGPHATTEDLARNLDCARCMFKLGDGKRCILVTQHEGPCYYG